ncbi:MAG TPA: hypothetical protein VMT95_01255 [Candidatus Binatia bacterium]|nr:hypothetical protein [Candidatus Binatia bacterium]
MSFSGRSGRQRSSVDATELDWLRDHGVRIDEKGRIIVSLPTPDDELGFRNEEQEPSISELMRREIGRRQGGSRGRRRSAPKASHRTVPGCAKRPAQPPRLGRPAVGDELRVYVQTTIAPQTRETLTKRGLTLAKVLDDCARELADAF